MDGITDLPYRTIVKKIFDAYNTDHELWLWTEFMNTDGYMTQPAKLIKHLIHHEQEVPLFAQIYGWNPDTLIKTAQDIEQKYPTFAGIELNIGCPSPKVIACGWWSGMMKDKKQCLQIIKDISQSISMPFSIKVRTWLNDQDKEEQFAMLVAAAPYCHTITVHWRTFNQWHSNIVDRDFIYRLKKEVWDICKIIGNGGITWYDDAIRHCEEWALANDVAIQDNSVRLDWIMTAQAAIGNPRVFVNHIPTLQERYDIIIQHLQLSIAYEIWFKSMMEQYPSNLDDLILQANKLVLHYKKKIDDDDTLVHTQKETKKHWYKLPFPTLQDIENIARNISPDDTHPYRSIVEFRKYLFNYIKGIPGSKECKQEIAKTQNYHELYHLMIDFFQKAQNTSIQV
jgi:tRNA-dihydrouridine synthase